MNWIIWIVIGLVAGVLAKALMPGSDREPKGCLMTVLLGIAGSVLVGWLMTVAGLDKNGGPVATIIGATIGAMILIFLMRKLWR